jgi:hypothetical protein
VSHYTDFVDNFKLAHPDEFPAISRRNIKIWNMLLNRLGIPETLHEPVTAILVTGNWEDVKDFEEITVMRMARNMTINFNDQQRLYNRLKKSLPKFFDWQSHQSYQIIDREIIHDQGQKYKTKARYQFLIYEIVHKLFSLPSNTTLVGVQRAVERALESIPIQEVLSEKRSRPKDPDKLAKRTLRDLDDLEQVTGSMESAVIQMDFNDTDGRLDRLAKALSYKTSQGERSK